MITAKLNNYRQSPRKVRLVASLISGKPVVDAIALLPHVAKRSAKPLATLINSAVANAKHNFSLSADTLIIKEFRVDAGATMKRSMPRAHGSAYPIRKRTSHITLILAPKAESLPAPKKSAKAVAEKVAPKKVVKAKATK
ncbi:MAG: 50S ribosomal protein L22 [Patescibacteria group bacterium]